LQQLVAGAAAKLAARSFTIDGEAVVCGVDGVAVFEALQRLRRSNGLAKRRG
jgi:ATP-dependent DNA ligase